MKNWNNKFLKNFKIFISIFIVIISFKAFSNNINIEIQGNNFTDEEVILSLINIPPKEISEDYSNYLLKTLDNSKLFENVSVKIADNKYIILITEYSNINNIFFKNNERLKDEDLIKLSKELNIKNLDPSSIQKFILEVKKIYNSFGYNNTEISYYDDLDIKTNTANLYFEINEGDITKIKNIYFSGNNLISSQILKSKIKSRTKTLMNIFANNNFKEFIVDNDNRLISNYYKNNGFIDIKVESKIEFLNSNKVNIYFKIDEGEIYYFSTINFLDSDNLISTELSNKIREQLNSSISKKEFYSLVKIDELKDIISNLLIENGIEFFEINSLEKINENKVDLLFDIKSVNPKYIKQINILGNSRTYDYVIRRELEIIEGDAINKTQINKITKKLKSLNLFKSVEVIEKDIDDNLINLEINIEEKQTGTFNAGVAVGSLEGFAVVAGLSERNFYGTGRSLKALLNTSDDKNEFTFETTDRIFYENDVDISYKANFKEEDFSKTASYNLDTFTTGVGFSYNINSNIKHNVDLNYVIKDYTITNQNTVASTISKSAGENISFLLSNNIYHSSLNSIFRPQSGKLISFNNFIETPTSSSNGYIKNTLMVKNYKKIDKNILSIQARLGNITSLSNNDILTDDKFSLGGRWLRGFDNFGAGPRNSRTSYVGGNNLIVTKLDYSREILNNSDFPILLNIFNDYGLVWENKTDPTKNDNSLRSSVGFGLKYYSPIGPIGFSWGFPIMDEDYDINRMFLFSVGNID